MKGKDFVQQSQKLSANVVNVIKTSLGLISLDGAFTYDDTIEQVEKELASTISKQQRIELDSIVNKSAKNCPPICPKQYNLSLMILAILLGTRF